MARFVSTTIFITGTDTGVGKTVLTQLLAAAASRHPTPFAALKPVCSGGRADARALHALPGCQLTLDEINPWHFRAPVAPLLAAERQGRPLARTPVLCHLRACQKKFPLLLIEGAGGLLSPLGQNFDSRDLIAALDAHPLLVAPNRLGVINHVRLARFALPKPFQARLQVVLMAPPRPDASATSNADLLAHYLPAGNIHLLPWLGAEFDPVAASRRSAVSQVLRTLLGLGLPHGLPKLP